LASVLFSNRSELFSTTALMHRAIFFSLRFALKVGSLLGLQARRLLRQQISNACSGKSNVGEQGEFRNPFPPF
jgi:hypothetical protein